MSKLLQEKDRQWRDRPNGATPVFDPGLSALGTDDEAGGAKAQPASRAARPEPELMSPTPVSAPHGPRLSPALWWTALGLLAAALVIAGIASLA